MTTQSQPPPPSPAAEPPPSVRGVYIAAYILLGLLLAWILVQRWLRPLVLEEPLSIVSSQPADGSTVRLPGVGGPIDSRVDPNTASWAELTSLPRVGEAMARRIVEYRENLAARAPGRPAFTCPQDLEAIHGIGPKTIELMAPHLKFPASRPN